MTLPPERIETERLVVRVWKTEGAQIMTAAIDSSLLHLQEWMPWAMHEPSELPVIKRRIEEFDESFAAGREWIYGIFDGATNPSVDTFGLSEREPLGGIGLHTRIEPGGLEIGYWLGQIRQDTDSRPKPRRHWYALGSSSSGSSG